MKSDIASNALAKKKFKDLVEDVMRYLQNRRYYGDEYVRDVIFGVLWFRMKKYEGKTE